VLPLLFRVNWEPEPLLNREPMTQTMTQAITQAMTLRNILLAGAFSAICVARSGTALAGPATHEARAASAAADNVATPRRAAGDKLVWKPVEFAIVRYNDDAPASWNMYHGEKKGLLLIRLWRRYLFLNVQDQEVFELDPAKVKVQADNNIEWSSSDLPADPIETSEWKTRDIGPMRRVRFRFGKTGNFLDIQLPLQINGKPLY
jgi:hypothetical protein